MSEIAAENTRPQLAELGALTRIRREDKSLSMDQLAKMAGIGRSTLFRFETGKPVQVAPGKIAKVLVVLGISAEEVISLVQDAEILDELLAWLDRASQVQTLQSYAQSKRIDLLDPASNRPDYIAIHPEGTMLYIEVKDRAETDPEKRGDDLVRVLASAGYMVTRPAMQALEAIRNRPAPAFAREDAKVELDAGESETREGAK